MTSDHLSRYQFVPPTPQVLHSWVLLHLRGYKANMVEIPAAKSQQQASQFTAVLQSLCICPSQ